MAIARRPLKPALNRSITPQSTPDPRPKCGRCPAPSEVIVGPSLDRGTYLCSACYKLEVRRK